MRKSKYKILFADDEFWARESFKKLIDWEAYAVEYLEPAKDGQDVLEKVIEFSPDILITDINMPFIDGVTLVRTLKETHPDLVTIVLSGYDDYSYVRETLTQGALDYLVKPISKIDLIQTLSNAFEYISTRERTKKNNEVIEERLSLASSILQDMEFSRLINSQSDGRFSQKVEFNELSRDAEKLFVCVKIHSLHDYRINFNSDLNTFSHSIKKEIKKIFNSPTEIVFNHIYQPNEFIVLADLPYSKTAEAAGQLIEAFEILFKSPISVVIEKNDFNKEHLKEKYQQAKLCLADRELSDKSLILNSDNHKKGLNIKRALPGFDSSLFEREFGRILETQNNETIKQWVLGQFGLRDYELPASVNIARDMIVVMCDVLVSTSSLQKSSLGEYKHSMLTAVENLEIEELKKMIEELISFCKGSGTEYCSTASPQIVKNIVKYLDEFYFQDISLHSLSTKFGLEQSYLSRLFHQLVGDSFISYLTNKRIEKATSYLLNSNLPLTEIAFLVGYNDYAYFSRVFKKITGKSPKDYRL